MSCTSVVLAAVLGCMAVSSVQVQAQGGATAPENALVPGDAIRLAFWREPELDGEYPVDETGTVVLPLLGHRKVTEVPPGELKETLLREYAEQLRNQEVQVTLLRRVRVLGAVHVPGLYYVDPTMTLGDAIALAGGATSDGKLEDIKIFRGGEQISSDLDTTVSVAEQVRSGDQIVVPERSWIERKGAVVIAAMVTATALIFVAVSK